MDELDQAVEVFCRHGFVLLVKVVDVAVEDLDEEFDGDGGVHAGVCNAEGALEAFEDALAVAVELYLSVWSILRNHKRTYILRVFFASVRIFDNPPKVTG